MKEYNNPISGAVFEKCVSLIINYNVMEFRTGIYINPETLEAKKCIVTSNKIKGIERYAVVFKSDNNTKTYAIKEYHETINNILLGEYIKIPLKIIQKVLQKESNDVMGYLFDNTEDIASFYQDIELYNTEVSRICRYIRINYIEKDFEN